jgi:hypothetical protein
VNIDREGYLLVGCRHCAEQFEASRCDPFWALTVTAHGVFIGAGSAIALAQAVPLTCPQSAGASGDD